MHLCTEFGACRKQYNIHLTPYIETTRNARSYKPKSIEWENAAIEVKDKKGKKRKFLPLHTPSIGFHQLKSLS